MTGTELRTLRQALGLTLTETGELLGYSYSAVSRFETGSRRIPDRAAKIIRLTLGKKYKRQEKAFDIGKETSYTLDS